MSGHEFMSDRALRRMERRFARLDRKRAKRSPADHLGGPRDWSPAEGKQRGALNLAIALATLVGASLVIMTILSHA